MHRAPTSITLKEIKEKLMEIKIPPVLDRTTQIALGLLIVVLVLICTLFIIIIRNNKKNVIITNKPTNTKPIDTIFELTEDYAQRVPAPMPKIGDPINRIRMRTLPPLLFAMNSLPEDI